MDISIKKTPSGVVLSTNINGVDYSQWYGIRDTSKAVDLFKRLIYTYETKGVEYVMRYGSI